MWQLCFALQSWWNMNEQKTAQERPKEEDQGGAALLSFSIFQQSSKASHIYFQTHKLLERNSVCPKGCLVPISPSLSFLHHFSFIFRKKNQRGTYLGDTDNLCIDLIIQTCDGEWEIKPSVRENLLFVNFSILQIHDPQNKTTTDILWWDMKCQMYKSKRKKNKQSENRLILINRNKSVE